MTQQRIVILDAGSQGDDVAWDALSELGELVLYENTTKENFLEHAKGATALLTNKVPISQKYLDQLPDLRYIGVIATGYNIIDIEAAKKRGVVVCNVPAYSTYSVMQHTFALILALSSQICHHATAVANGEWSASKHFCFWKQPLTELHGKTLGVVGFGDTGQAVARMGNNFGMSVLAYAPRPKPLPEYIPFAFAELAELFATADVVTLHCPSTPENKGFVNASLLAKMKKTAFFINCSRGDLVNEEDLATALQSGTLAGAGLDVVSREPMLDSNPLRHAPNCLITPHLAWSTLESRQRLIKGVCDNFRTFLSGKPTNVVNR